MRLTRGLPKCAEARRGPWSHSTAVLETSVPIRPTYHGIVVLRPREQNVDAILRLVQRLVALLKTNSLVGALWIVDERRFRILR